MHEYPHLADLPISRTHGRKLRRIVTEAEWHDVMVESDQPTEGSFQVSELARRDAATWADALSAFLTAHTKYEGLLARFATGDGDQFDVPLADAWGEEYSKKQYARALALQRQMAGGDRPTGGEAVAAWESPATAMLTLTGSSVPGGNRIPPVEHTDALHDSFSYNGVRDTLRNTMEYHLGLEADDWGYWLQAEPHGVGDAADPDASPGMNACYTHLHVGVYFEATDLNLEAVGPEFERVVDKHVAECEYATFDAHDYRNVDYLEDSHGCISLNADVGNMGSYLATYMGGYTEDLLDKPIEYLAWGAIYWSAARRRTSRSKIVTSAVKADACEQRAEHPESRQTLAHGEDVKWNDGNGLDVVCSCCGSGWSVDQTQLDEPISDEELTAALDDDTEDRVLSLSERWPSAKEAASIGELPTRARIRSKVEEYLELYDPSPVLIPHLLGELMIDPIHAPIVREVVDGQEPEPESFRRPISSDEWELVAIVDRDGEEHQPGGGGVDMVPLKLPVQQILDETRLRHDLRTGEVWRCSECRTATHDTVWMARHLVETHGLDRPESADSVLHVEDYYDLNRECMKHPAERDRQTGSVEPSYSW
ncbi:Putative rep protein [Halogranum gelatinilyticum]|uniref:Putative rep protein n=1 Tax=Halogranum gelatinilyticum TaxID=660521 RepID=A0A1G9THH6_9EURY|nr:hypothetical protein [Halogranum gelatinilyticum]SDM47093.1 Putative rep protein [Halogranum gelatinilyticum]